jgi:hypothetical protein
VEKTQALAGIIILAISFASIIPSQAARTTAIQIVTTTSIIRVTTTINLTAAFAFQNQGTYKIPILVVNATLVATGNGLIGIIARQQLNLSITWGPPVSCITDGQGICYLTFSIPPLGGANTITAMYSGTTYFAPCAVTKVV